MCNTILESSRDYFFIMPVVEIELSYSQFLLLGSNFKDETTPIQLH